MTHPYLHQAETWRGPGNQEENLGESSKPTSFCTALQLPPGAETRRSEGGLKLCAKHREAREKVKSNKGSVAAATGGQVTNGDGGALATAPFSLSQRAQPAARRVYPYLVK